MGNQPGKGGKVNTQIEQKMKESEYQNHGNHALLLLGPAESGKSTLLRQMRHIWGKQFQTKERQNFQKMVWENVCECIQILCNESQKLSETFKDCKIDLDKNKQALEFTMKVQKTDIDVFDKEMYEYFQSLWNDPGIQNTLKHRDRYYLMDCAEYFLNEMNKLIGKDYVPTFSDVCHCRYRTSGIKTESFVCDNAQITITDVGGQRGERKKWLNACDDMKAIIYVTSLVGYNQVIFEDQKKNRLLESFEVYEQYINNKVLEKVNVILFLNKRDLFEEMIQEKPFIDPYNEYKDDPKNKDKIIQYISGVFQKKTNGFGTHRVVYRHIVCATNTEDVKVVFTDVKHILIQQELKHAAII